MRTKSIIYGISLFAAVALMAGCKPSGSGSNVMSSKQYVTCYELFHAVSVGCDGYKTAHGTWPGSIKDLNSVIEGLIDKDGWGHDFVFNAFDSGKGYGSIVSYGRDGKPGGNGEDADLEIRFPLKENADWNRNQAKSVPLPSQLKDQPNWYESFLQ